MYKSDEAVSEQHKSEQTETSPPAERRLDCKLHSDVREFAALIRQKEIQPIC
jgi:hypothetical protein